MERLSTLIIRHMLPFEATNDAQPKKLTDAFQTIKNPETTIRQRVLEKQAADGQRKKANTRLSNLTLAKDNEGQRRKSKNEE